MFTKFTKKSLILMGIILTILIILICSFIPVGIKKYHCSQMLEAIENDDMEKLQNAIEHGEVNSVPGIPLLEFLMIEFSERKTPLQAACAKGNLEMVKLLLESGADPQYRPLNASVYALCYAVQCGSSENLQIVKLLLEADVNAYAHACNSYPSSIEDGASRAIDDLLKEYPFPSNGMEMLRELVTAGGTPGREGLRKAFYWGNDAAIRYLVEECGYNISGRRYILLYGRGSGKYSYETFEFMLQRGADPYAKDVNGVSAIDYLRENSPEWAETLAELAKKYGFPTWEERFAKLIKENGFE